MKHVAHVCSFEKNGRPMIAWDNAKDIKQGDRLYVAPKQWVGLTAYEIQEIHSGNQHWGNFACAIEAKLKEKNGGEYRNGATTERTKLKEKNNG